MFLFKLGFLDVAWVDILDILLVAFLLYQIYLLVRGSLASRVFLGYLFMYLFYLIVRALGLELLTKILEYFMGVGAIALIIIFQQEIRRFLLYIGKSTDFANNKILSRFFKSNPVTDKMATLKPVIEAAKALAAEFAGAIIVIKKNDELDKYIDRGEPLDALLSKRLFVSIFNEYSPLNEGAAIVYDGRIKAARCILPVSDSEEYSNLGFRHRAALGMSEATDAAVIVISEESGRVALAIDGDVFTNLSIHDLEDRLSKYLFEV